MFRLLIRKFIKDPEDVSSPAVRGAYGALCGVFGIVMNLLLFAVKLAAALISGSIAVAADSLNNLSDAGSSLITLFGFRLAAHKPDSRHPFGHGRMEYISGLFVSVLIIIMGFELGKSSVERIWRPVRPAISAAVLVILAVSAAVKFYMYLCYRGAGKKIESAALLAAARDSLSDMVSTFAVLISSVICLFTDLDTDPYFGLAVAAFILKEGVSSLIDTVNPLLGQAPDPGLEEEILRIAGSFPGIIGVHDLIIHDYGPGRKMASLHAEVPASGSLSDVHETVDKIETRIKEELGCEAVIHTDPVMTDDPLTKELGAKLREAVSEISPDLCIHDFRVSSGTSGKKLIFDLVMPFDSDMSEDELIELTERKVSGIGPDLSCRINIDRAAVERSEKGRKKSNG